MTDLEVKQSLVNFWQSLLDEGAVSLCKLRTKENLKAAHVELAVARMNLPATEGTE